MRCWKRGGRAAAGVAVDRLARARPPLRGSGRVGSVCVPVAAVCVAVLNRRFRAEAGACPLTRPAALPPHPVGTSTTLRGGCCEHRFDSLSELACRGSRRGRAHISRCASSAPRGALRPRLGYPTRLTPRRTVQALYRQSSLSGSRYRARWRHESRIFVIVDKFSGIRSHCTLPPLYPPITDGPNIGVMSGRQCVAGSVAAALRQASRSSRSTSAAAPSMGVRPSRVGLRGRGGCCDQRRGAVPVNKAGRLL